MSAAANRANMPPLTADIMELLTKTKHYDSDERYMALRDLIEKLKLMNNLEASVQVPIRDSILRLLDDGSSDVSTAAIKCLSFLVVKLAPEQLTIISDRLGTYISNPRSANQSMSSGEDETAERRTSSLEVITDALQTLITNASLENGRLLAPKLIRSILAGLEQPTSNQSSDLTMACLTLLKQILEKYGSDISEQHEAVMMRLLHLLEHPTEAVTKRTSATFAPLVIVLNDALFTRLMETLIKSMINNAQPEIYIQSLSAISRAAGVRVGNYLADIVPALITFLTLSKREQESEEPEERRIEMLETCLQAIYAIILRCPSKVTPYVHSLVSIAINLSKWDPLYTYEDDSKKDNHTNAMQNNGDDDEQMKDAEDDGWNDGGGQAEADEGWGTDDTAASSSSSTARASGWGDDDEATSFSSGSNDTSWKVRRAAFSVLGAFIKARSDLLRDIYMVLCDHLVSRMNEHDSAVKEELMLTTRLLLHESTVSDRMSSAALKAVEASSSAMSDEMPVHLNPIYSRTRSTFASLEIKIPSIVTSMEKEFAHSDVRTQKAIFGVVHELLLVKHGQMQPYFAMLVPHIINGIQGTVRLSEVNADALELANLMLQSHSYSDLEPHIVPITKATLFSLRHGLPKNIPSALHVLSAIARLIKSSLSIRQSIAGEIFRVVFAQLEQRDVPLDVKLSSISTMAVLISCCSHEIGTEVELVWPVLSERLSNESTCQQTLKAVTKIAHSDQHIDCSPMIDNCAQLISFLRRSSSPLRHDAVRCLEALVRAHPSAFRPEQIGMILREAAPHIVDSDLQLAHLQLDLMSTILLKGSDPSAALQLMASDIQRQAVALACSPLLQSATLTSLLQFLRLTIVARAHDQRSSAFNKLFRQLHDCVNERLDKAAYPALAKCMAVVCSDAPESDCQRSIKEAIASTRQDSAQRAELALLFLGELAPLRAAKPDKPDVPELEAVCVAAFDHASERVRPAAAKALGSVSIGAPQRYLPSLLGLIRDKPAHRFLLFTALKELLSHFCTAGIEQLVIVRPWLAPCTPVLLATTSDANESTRSIVSECLGLDAVIDPQLLLPQLVALALSTSAICRAVVASAIRYAFIPQMDYAALAPHLGAFASLLADVDIEVQRQAVITWEALLRANGEIVPRELFSDRIVPVILKLTIPRPELVREVDYGAFKQKIDDGKPLRKAAYACIDTLVRRSPHRVHLPTLIKAIEQGFADADDIQQVVYATITHLAVHQPSAILEQVDSFPKIMMAPVKVHLNAIKSIKDNKSTTDNESLSAMDCLKACVRALLALNAISGIEQATNYTHFYKQVSATQALAQIIRNS